MLYWTIVGGLAYEMIGLLCVFYAYRVEGELKREMDDTYATSKGAYVFCVMGTALFWPFGLALWLNYHVRMFFYRRRVKAMTAKLRKRMKELDCLDSEVGKAIDAVERMVLKR